ncbi:hypothetical protein VPH35_001405 [Triticum aestivum]
MRCISAVFSSLPSWWPCTADSGDHIPATALRPLPALPSAMPLVLLYPPEPLPSPSPVPTLAAHRSPSTEAVLPSDPHSSLLPHMQITGNTPPSMPHFIWAMSVRIACCCSPSHGHLQYASPPPWLKLWLPWIKLPPVSFFSEPVRHRAVPWRPLCSADGRGVHFTWSGQKVL